MSRVGEGDGRWMTHGKETVQEINTYSGLWISIEGDHVHSSSCTRSL